MFPLRSRLLWFALSVGLLAPAVLPARTTRLTRHSGDQLRARIRSAFYVPTPLPQLRPASFGSFTPAPGVRAERVTYATEYGLRVPAILYLPDPLPKQRIPALIVVDGHGGDKYSWYSFYSGILYARGGAAVLTYDVIGEGERNVDHRSGTRAHDHLSPDRQLGQRMGGLMMTDLMQAVSYLRRRPEVDPHRIGAMGYSMGSFVTALGCAVETRLSACVMTGGGDLDGPGGYWDSSTKYLCQGYPYQALSFLGDRGAVLYALQSDHADSLAYNGSADEVVAIPTHGPDFFRDLQQRARALSADPQRVFTYDFHPATSHRPYFVTRRVALWLDAHLHFPLWTQQQIATMPISHISVWAQQNHVFIDHGYIQEIREGGTEALGNFVPGVPHDELNVLHLAQWQQQKQQMILKTWLADAENQMGYIPPPPVHKPHHSAH